MAGLVIVEIDTFCTDCLLWSLLRWRPFVQIVFSGVFLLTPGKEAYRVKAHDAEQELPMLSGPRANTLTV